MRTRRPARLADAMFSFLWSASAPGEALAAGRHGDVQDAGGAAPGIVAAAPAVAGDEEQVQQGPEQQGVPRRRRLHRRAAGWKHTTAAKEKMTRRRLRGKCIDSAKQVAALNKLVHSEAAKAVSTIVFGLNSTGKLPVNACTTLAINGCQYEVQTNAKKQNSRVHQRGITSLARAQSKSLADFIRGGQGTVLLKAVIDDTNVWTHFEELGRPVHKKEADLARTCACLR